MMPTLAAVVITKNEEDNIERCIKSAQFADEVVVIDAKSNDNTIAIAKQLGATVYVRPWPGYGPQKNFGTAQTHSEWLLFLDADEEISPDLAHAIQTTLHKPLKDFYWLKIITKFLDRPLHHIYSFDPRLFRRDAGTWTSHHIIEKLQTNAGQVITINDSHSSTLKQPLYHHAYQTVTAYRKHMTENTALDAQHMAKHDQHRSGRTVHPYWFLPYYLAVRQFIKLALYKHGLFDGYAGLMWSALAAQYEYVLGKKYLRLKSGQRTPHEPVLR